MLILAKMILKKSLGFFLLFALSTIAFTSSKQPTETASNRLTPLVDLSASNFNGHVQPNENGPWFIMFYAPNASEAKKTMPALNDLSNKLYGHINIARVDWYSLSIIKLIYLLVKLTQHFVRHLQIKVN